MINELLATHQARLADLGYYTGIVDGLDGVLTRLAMTRFKEGHGFRARPYPGPMTLTALWSDKVRPYTPPESAAGDHPPWIKEAIRLLGTDETPGQRNNPTIMQWAKDLDQWYPDDSTPWCGLFVAHCMRVGAPKDPQDFNRLGAREWIKFGYKLDKAEPGCIGVFWRGRPDGWQGHVGFIMGEDKGAWHVLGGNQSDSVNVIRVSKRRSLGYVWPKTVASPVPRTAPMASVTTGALSHNEA
jgi:uncharacterized protein (TIGR02594 family)